MADDKLFTILADISQTKLGPQKHDVDEKDYNAFVVNRFLASEPDCVLYANDMNLYHRIPPLIQYEYLMKTIAPRKRYFRWGKKGATDDMVGIVAEYYDFSRTKAQQVIQLHTPQQLKEIRKKMDRGGLVVRNKK